MSQCVSMRVCERDSEREREREREVGGEALPKFLSCVLYSLISLILKRLSIRFFFLPPWQRRGYVSGSVCLFVCLLPTLLKAL